MKPHWMDLPHFFFNLLYIKATARLFRAIARICLAESLDSVLFAFKFDWGKIRLNTLSGFGWPLRNH